MKEAIRFEVTDNSGEDTNAELMVDVENDVFEISVAGKGVMSGDWSRNLQKVLERALEVWKVGKEIKEENQAKEEKENDK
ncbi:MAG: hypothetical protein H8D45_28130 [Bacteroidetes bacterium]|nr:hypothetical protein [Bacteroidota bacterium]